jgi:aconitate hydratase
MPSNVAQKLIQSHLLAGKMIPGNEIALKIDQSLTQDSMGTMVMLELEAMGADKVHTELSAQYVDHNILQEDYKNADDHLFLENACQRFGIWYSRPGNGISHPVHMQYFAKPGKTLLGSDSHTCGNGCMGMLAIGAGGLEVAMAMAGLPFFVKMPKIFGVRLTGKLPDWVSAKDVILEMLRRHKVTGGTHCIIEYYGPGLKNLTAMDRHVIASMGAELGATSTVFPSDQETFAYLRSQGREADWCELYADKGATYDVHEEIDLAALEPLIALPSSPDKVVPVREITGREIYQAYIGSSANPAFRDFAISALMIRGRSVHSSVSFDINPASRNQLEELAQEGLLADLIHAGARIHQAGCNGCIGMGQAPATGRNSLRTVPRNFPGRSGNKEDSVYLCSPETATASALQGVITDPRALGMTYPKVKLPKKSVTNPTMIQKPLPPAEAKNIVPIKNSNITPLYPFKPLPNELQLQVLLKVADNISTDEILEGGAKVLPYRSNIPKSAEFTFRIIDETYAQKAKALHDAGEQHAIVAGANYGQGSSREHAALVPRYCDLQVVIAKGFARIHWQNLINVGILPLTFVDPNDYDKIMQNDRIVLTNIHPSLRSGNQLTAQIKDKNCSVKLQHQLSERQIDILIAGGAINWVRNQKEKRV